MYIYHLCTYKINTYAYYIYIFTPWDGDTYILIRKDQAACDLWILVFLSAFIIKTSDLVYYALHNNKAHNMIIVVYGSILRFQTPLV